MLRTVEQAYALNGPVSNILNWWASERCSELTGGWLLGLASALCHPAELAMDRAAKAGQARTAK